MFAVLKTSVSLVLCLVAAALGLLIPAHIRSVDIATLRWTAEKGLSSDQKVKEFLNAGQLGPIERLMAATDIEAVETKVIELRTEKLLQLYPNYRVTGGPAATFERFLNTAYPAGIRASTPRSPLSLLLPRSERHLMAKILSNSSNANVQSLLQTRNLRGLVQLHPADHVAGAPYDAGVLTLAVLIQDAYLPMSHAESIGSLARNAAAGNPNAKIQYEELIIATLSIGRQLDFNSLASLARLLQSSTEWSQMATLFRNYPEAIDALYAASLFTESVPQIFEYFALHSETALTDIIYTLALGPAAVEALLNSNQPIHRPKSFLAKNLQEYADQCPQLFIQISAQNKYAGILIKFCLLIISGITFAFACSHFRKISMPKGSAERSKSTPTAWARDGFISLIIALLIWTLAEPEILKSQENTASTSPPRIQFAVADSIQSLQSPVKAMQELNQVTLLVLALFFIIQLVIYSFCLIKIREIAKQSVSPELKLKLLENEDQLFDFGLYVGLGGTVLSLILVAVGIVEASLMAAYASTLFGILFVALLKVINLRPYRRKLIMQSGGSTSNNPATLMKDIEL